MTQEEARRLRLGQEAKKSLLGGAEIRLVLRDLFGSIIPRWVEGEIIKQVGCFTPRGCYFDYPQDGVLGIGLK